MHRFIAISVLSFWAILFAGLAHLSLSGLLNQTPQGTSEFHLLAMAFDDFQIMPVFLMVIAALFFWAVLALLIPGDLKAYREVEAHSYGAAIFMMGACVILAFVKLDMLTTLPAVLVAALATCAAASQNLSLAVEPEIEVNHGQAFARHMALSAAHNSLLSRVSGRHLPGSTPLPNNVSPFPTKPFNGGNL